MLRRQKLELELAEATAKEIELQKVLSDTTKEISNVNEQIEKIKTQLGTSSSSYTEKVKAGLSEDVKKTIEMLGRKKDETRDEDGKGSSSRQHPLAQLDENIPLILVELDIAPIEDQTQKQQCAKINEVLTALGATTYGGVSGIGKSTAECVIEKNALPELQNKLSVFGGHIKLKVLSPEDKHRFETPVANRKHGYKSATAEEKFCKRIGYLLASSKKKNYRSAWLLGIDEDGPTFNKCIMEEKRLRKERRRSKKAKAPHEDARKRENDTF